MKYMGSPLENGINQSGQALHMDGMDSGDTFEPDPGMRNCFKKDLFDRTMVLERAASRFLTISIHANTVDPRGG